MHASQISKLGLYERHRRLASGNERGPQKQVFGGITANGQFGRDEQANATLVSRASGVNDFAGIARHVTNSEIELGYTELKRHG